MKQIRVTAVTTANKGMIQSGWFADVAKGEQYAAAMLNRGYIVARMYRNMQP